MTKLMEEEIQPILVPAVLEHEGISGISGGDKPRSVIAAFETVYRGRNTGSIMQ